MQQDAQEDEGDAEVEGEIDLAAFAKDEEGKDNGVAGLEVIGKVDGEGRQALERLNLEQIHANRAEQRVAEHKPQISATWNDHNGLLTGEEPQIDGDDGRDND